MNKILYKQVPNKDCLAHKFNYASIENLPADIICNGIKVFPTFRYNGKDANSIDWPSWGYGQTLILQPGTAPTFCNGSPLLGQLDCSVKFNAGGYYKASNTSFADLATEDFIIEIIFQNYSTSTEVMADKMLSQTSGGWFLWDSNARNLILRLAKNDGSSNITITSAGFTLGTYNHAMFFANRDENSTNGAEWIINGTLIGSGVNISNYASSVTNNSYFSLGSAEGSLSTLGKILYIAGWYKNNWFKAGIAGPSEWSSIANIRFSKLTNIYLNKANGEFIPNLYTRNSPSYVEKLENDGSTKLYYVGNNWLRSLSKIDNNNNIVKGLLTENIGTNLWLGSELSDRSRIGISPPIMNAVVAPNGELTADRLVEDNSLSRHIYYQSLGSAIVSNDYFTYSVFLKKGDRQYVALAIYHEVGAVHAVGIVLDFNTGLTSTGIIGTNISIINSGIEQKGNGWYRLFICGKFLLNIVQAYAIMYILPTFVFSNNNWQGDPLTFPLGVTEWGFQLTKNEATYPSSYIPTTTLASVRSPDLYRLSGQFNIFDGEGGIRWWICSTNYIPTMQKTIEVLSSGGNVNNRILLYIDIDKYVKFVSTKVAGNSGSGNVPLDVCDGKIHEILLTWRKNEMNVCVDGIWGIPDTLVDIPTNLDRCDIGVDQSGINQIGPIILLAGKHYSTFQSSFYNKGGGFSCLI
ncbi:MAG: hypothetical protein WC516_08365 [Patescibacteria group bacterium]|jgi:hypothetical protein